MDVRVKKVRKSAKLPVYGSKAAAGADLFACLDAPVTILPGHTEFLPTGIAVELPQGTVGFVCARSGLACKRDLAPANKVGVIDSDYRGEILVALHNHGSEPRIIEPEERIAQLIVLPYYAVTYEESESLCSTERGEGGFGSTGTR